jgi:hypothetical protein
MLDPGLKMREHLCFANAIFLYSTIQYNCSACNIPLDAGLQKRANFSTQIVGLARSGDRTQAPYVAGSDDKRLAIYYNYT